MTTSSSTPGCPSNLRRLARSSQGEAGRWNLRARRLARHIADCPNCSAEAEALQQSADAARRALQQLVRERLPEFTTIQYAVRARVARQSATAPRPVSVASSGGWSLALPVAAVLTGLAVLVLRPGLAPSGRHDEPRLTATVQDPVELSSTADGIVRVEVADPSPEPHRVAVSTRAWDFSKAEVFEIRGRNWVDPTPDPPAGQAYFYRVD